ncbi:hypothetical protein JHW43_000210 [Diplocarpon mali]|nr:hypothetical protein JHW43_000210 [Diplocarpon mali]
MSASGSACSQNKETAKSQGHDASAVDGPHNDWKFREPYQIHTNDGFTSVHEGGCHCGKISTLTSTHHSGAPFQHAAIFNKSDINFLRGHHDLRWYDSSEKTTRHKLPCKVSCAHCGSLIMDEGRKMILLFPGGLDDAAVGRAWGAECHMFYADRAVDVNDGLPKWAGMQGQSELIADSPAEAVKKRKREVEEEESAKKREGEEMVLRDGTVRGSDKTDWERLAATIQHLGESGSNGPQVWYTSLPFIWT